MLKFKTSFGLLVLMIIFGCSNTTGSLGTILNDVEEIESGSYSNYPEEGLIQKVITSQAEFNTEWEKIHEGSTPVPDKPFVNFETRSVLLLMLETKPSGGYGITNFNVYETADNIEIRFSEVEPGPQCGTTQAMTRPYKAVSIPKTDKDFSFQKEERTVSDCSE